MRNIQPTLKICLLAVLSAYSAQAVSAPAEQTLQNIQVSGKRLAKQNTAEHKKREDIDRELIRDNNDLVRYSPDVGISQSGTRHSKGFAMRGVEGNRVGVSIDGVSLPDSEENSLYARYGNFNNSRMSIDTELVRGIDVEKGANSFRMGSGALGGGVNYRTLDAGNLLQDDNRFGGLIRSGYASKNREWANTVGLATGNERADFMLLYSQRRGHETKSSGKGEDTIGSARGIPDPARHKYHSFLSKFNWQLTDNQRVGVAFNGQQGHNRVNELSYNLQESSWREADDINYRRNLHLYHEFAPARYLSLVKTEFDYQKTDLASVSDKGSYPRDWSKPDFPLDYSKKDLDEVYDRRMKTTFHRLSLSLDGKPFQWGGTHQLSFKTFVSKRDFKNINSDSYYLDGKVYNVKSTIQHPVQTRQWGFSLLDSIQWNSRFSNQIGVRYDHTRLNPQALNENCNACETTIPAPSSFRAWNGFVDTQWRMNDAWRLNYQITTGYRIPTASEMYFTYKHPAGNWLANPHLKAERSLNQTITLSGNGRFGKMDLSAYHTRYKNFIFEQENAPIENGRMQLYQQMVNVDKARISGLEFSGSLKLPKGFSLMGSLGYSKGRLNNGLSQLPLQPIKAVIGLDYEHPEQRWGIFSRLTYMGAKKAKDAKILHHEQKETCLAYETEEDWWTGETYTYCSKRHVEAVESKETFPYLNRSAVVLDVFGYVRPTKNLTLRAGVYNLTNRRYATWDSFRSINIRSTTGSVDKDGKGLARFYAPGRNYSVSLEYKF